MNTLTNIFGKPVEDIFNEFDGKDYEEKGFDGDVKYHLGTSSDRHFDNIKVHLSFSKLSDQVSNKSLTSFSVITFCSINLSA